MRPTLLTTALLVLLSGCEAPAPESAAPPPPPPTDRTTLVQSAGSELFVRTVGEGPPVIVVHGGPVLEHGYLYPWLLPLASEWELIFYDQRLSGRSSPEAPPETISLDAFVADIEAVREATGHLRVDLIAHSWGGLLAQMYAARHPDRVRRMVLVGPLPPSAGLRLEEETAQRASMDPAVAERMEAVRATEAFQERTPEGVEAMLIAVFSGEFHDPALADSLDFDIPADHELRSQRFGALFPELQGYDLVDRLGGIEAATLILYGRDEVGATIGGPVLEAAIPNARLETIPESGHFPFIERPFLFLGRVAEFLETGR